MSVNDFSITQSGSGGNVVTLEDDVRGRFEWATCYKQGSDSERWSIYGRLGFAKWLPSCQRKKGDKNDKINLIRICKYVRSRVKVSSCLQQVLKNVIPPMPCFTPYCLIPSCFDALYKFTPLINLRPLIFGLTLFGSLLSIYLSLFLLWGCHFDLRLFLSTPSLSGTQLGRKTRPCTTVRPDILHTAPRLTALCGLLHPKCQTCSINIQRNPKIVITGHPNLGCNFRKM